MIYGNLSKKFLFLLSKLLPLPLFIVFLFGLWSICPQHFCSKAFAATSSGWRIITWIPGTQYWQEKFDINFGRSGCTLPAAEGIEFVKRTVKKNKYKKYFLSIYNPAGIDKDVLAERLRENALLYSQLSLNVPELEEIGIDDFLDKYRNWFKKLPNPSQVLNTVIDNTKKYNPNLKFGITLYVHELGTDFAIEQKLPASIRNKIDYVHLFVLNRKNGLDYAAHVARTKQLFPHARIIGGVYPFDRIDYVPCDRKDSSKQKCTPQQEIGLFKQTLEIQARLLRNGELYALEFYPGLFGMEERTIQGHGKSAPARKGEALAITKQMTQDAYLILNKWKNGLGK
jgi:hypothetical protein